MYIVYKHKNLINGKIYIGQTKNYDNPEIRWKGGTVYNTFLRNDLLKYDWNTDFSHDILIAVKTKEEANIYEKYYIMFFQSIVYGYNILEGGDCVPIFKHTPNSNIANNKKPRFVKIINSKTKNEEFRGKWTDAMQYIKNNIYPPITSKTLLTYIRDEINLESELRCGDSFLIKKAVRRRNKSEL